MSRSLKLSPTAIVSASETPRWRSAFVFEHSGASTSTKRASGTASDIEVTVRHGPCISSSTSGSATSAASVTTICTGSSVPSAAATSGTRRTCDLVARYRPAKSRSFSTGPARSSPSPSYTIGCAPARAIVPSASSASARGR